MDKERVEDVVDFVTDLAKECEGEIGVDKYSSRLKSIKLYPQPWNNRVVFTVEHHNGRSGYDTGFTITVEKNEYNLTWGTVAVALREVAEFFMKNYGGEDEN